MNSKPGSSQRELPSRAKPAVEGDGDERSCSRVRSGTRAGVRMTPPAIKGGAATSADAVESAAAHERACE